MTTTSPRLYDTDFYGWIQSQTQALRAGHFSSVDVDNLVEEIESIGKSQQRALESRLEILLGHLLKWQFQPDHQGNSWRFTIEEQRARIDKLLVKNPSLKSHIPTALEEAYEFAIRLAVRETGLAATVFPASCPWPFEQAMQPDFWPTVEPPCSNAPTC